jgi:hypothetical protein
MTKRTFEGRFCRHAASLVPTLTRHRPMREQLCADVAPEARNRMASRLAWMGGILLLVTAASPVMGSQGKCLAGKNKCVSKKAASLLKCHQNAETPGKPIDPNYGGCITKAEAKFDGGLNPAAGCFARLESAPGNDCQPPLGNTASMEAVVDDCVDQIVGEIDPAPIDQSKCNVGKKKCAATYLKSVLKCHQKAEAAGEPFDPGYGSCIPMATYKFNGGGLSLGCFDTVESKPGNDCVPPLNNKHAVRSLVESCVSEIVSGLTSESTTSTSSTTTSSTTTSSTTSTLVCGFGGEDIAGSCWYLGNDGETCDQACTNHGGQTYDPATKSYAGSDGTLAQCEEVATALGVLFNTSGDTNGAAGMGCAAAPSADLLIRDVNPTTSNASVSGFVRICACQQTTSPAPCSPIASSCGSCFSGVCLEHPTYGLTCTDLDTCDTVGCSSSSQCTSDKACLAIGFGGTACCAVCP